MLLLLAITAYGLLWFTQKQRNQDWRGASLSAAALWGAFLVYSTEILSVPNWIILRAVALIWIAFCAAIVLLLRFVLAKTQTIPPTPQVTEEPMLGKEWRFFLAGTGVVVSLVGLTALLSPPNTRDSMQYHMPRIVEWALLREQTPNVRLRYVGVTNRSAVYQRPDMPFPCAVICFTCAREPRKWAEYSSLGGAATVMGEAVIFEGRNQNQDGTPAAVTLQTQPVTPASGRGPEPSQGKS